MNTMNTLDILYVRSLGLLVDATWGVALLLGALWVSARLFRRASASFRSMAWNAGFGAALLLPLLLALLPVSSSLWHLTSRRADGIKSSVQSEHEVKPVSATATGAPRVAPISEPARSPDVRDFEMGPDIIRYAIWCWFAGVMFVLARFGAGHLVLHHRSRQIDGALEADWGSAAEEAARMLELSDDVTLLQSQDTFAPAIWGFRNPTLFLPAKVKWSFERKLVILLHEFAHIKRRDSQALWLQQFVAALYWFNPIVLVSLAEARKACEQACDDMVLGSGVRPSDYASHLLEISESMLPGKSSGAVFCFLGTRTLENRLTAILDPLVSRSAPNIFAKTLGWIAIASSLLVLAASCPFALAEQSAVIPSSASNPGAPQAENPILPAPVSVNKPRQDSPLTASSSPNPP